MGIVSPNNTQAHSDVSVHMLRSTYTVTILQAINTPGHAVRMYIIQCMHYACILAFRKIVLGGEKRLRSVAPR